VNFEAIVVTEVITEDQEKIFRSEVDLMNEAIAFIDEASREFLSLDEKNNI
jgi:hypothetical protein